MPRSAALPFTLRRSRDAFTAREYISTKETVHGLLLLDGDRLRIQWRLARVVDRFRSGSMGSDEEVEEVREVVIPLEQVAGATVQRGGKWAWWRAPRLPAEEFCGELAMAVAEPLPGAHPPGPKVHGTLSSAQAPPPLPPPGTC